MFSITERNEGPWRLMVIHGEIDLASVPSLRSRCRLAISTGHHDLALDLGDVQLLDSVGLGVLIGLRRKAKEAGGSLVLVSVAPSVRSTLTASEVDHLFPSVAGVGALVALDPACCALTRKP